ncbi:MAG: hypothetical protein Q7S63_03385 [bacterium]|nr:hypothetical protein [bacterium]
MRSISKHLGVLFLLALLLPSGIAFAQGTEIQYPTLPNGVRLTLQPTLPEFILYLYYFLITASGFIAMGSVVLGGVQYLTSGGNVASQTAARSRISGAVIGILVLLGSSLLLGTINPQLNILRLEKPASPITPCDCSNPTQGFCAKICKPITEQKKVGSELLEVPAGDLVERVMDERTLAQLASIAQQAEDLAKDARDKAQAYKDELDRCSCSRNTVIPHCGGAPSCSALQCTGEPCDKAALAKKKKALEDANSTLAAYVEANIGVNITAE